MTFNGANTTIGPVVLEPNDRSCVFRITDKASQSITVKIERGGKSVEKTYGLSGLTLDPAPEPEEPIEG